jgi:hypothetical protein
MDFILDGCKLDFNQMLISNGLWRDSIILSIDEYYKKSKANDDDNDEVIEIEKPYQEEKKQNILDQGNDYLKA